jgi:saccharopine dehydrogenase-like NADP-dependent oxidoreductase
MRIVVVGGAGEVGSELVQDLARVEEIDSLVVADSNGARGRDIAAGLNSPRVHACELDVHDRESALKVLKGADVLMNCTSFSLFDTVFDLAVQAGVDYADLISEPSERHRVAAEHAGITAISGLGASPGLSNVLVRHAAEQLDDLLAVNISWVSSRTVAPTPGLLDTILWEVSEDCSTRCFFRDGRLQRAEFLEGSRVVEFAQPVGRQFVYYVPHPEVRTLPAHFPTLQECAVRGTWRAELMQDMRVLQRYGLLSPSALKSTKQAIWERLGGRRDGTPWMLYVNVEVTGTRGGELVRRTYKASHSPAWGEQGIGRMTGIPAAVGAHLLARHGRAAAGFVDPEEYYEPVEFLAHLERRADIAIECEEFVIPQEYGQAYVKTSPA